MIYLQDDLETFLRQNGLKKGDVVLLQANLDQERILADYSALVEAILTIITLSGLLIVPAFTLQALDPASPYVDYPIEEHEKIRKLHPGFSSKMMAPDQYKASSAALMIHTKAHRTEHPVFSLGWVGATKCKPTLSDIDFPLSYKHILQAMNSENAVNLLVDIPLDEAIYPLLEARKQEKDTIEPLSVFYRRVGKSFHTTFLSSRLNEEQLEQVIDNFDIRRSELGKLSFTFLRLKSSQESEK